MIMLTVKFHGSADGNGDSRVSWRTDTDDYGPKYSLLHSEFHFQAPAGQIFFFFFFFSFSRTGEMHRLLLDYIDACQKVTAIPSTMSRIFRERWMSCPLCYRRKATLTSDALNQDKWVRFWRNCGVS